MADPQKPRVRCRARDKYGRGAGYQPGYERRLADLREHARLNGKQSWRLERIRSASVLYTEIAQLEATLARVADLQAEVGHLSESMGQITATEEAVLPDRGCRDRDVQRKEARSSFSLACRDSCANNRSARDVRALVHANSRFLGDPPLRW